MQVISFLCIFIFKTQSWNTENNSSQPANSEPVHATLLLKIAASLNIFFSLVFKDA